MGPWPYGTQRTAIVKVLKEIKWQAKPIQPMGSNPYAPGTVWQIQAVDPPPTEVINTQHGEMVIAVAPVRPGPGGGSAGGRSGPSSEGAVRVDPWTIQDPWQSAAKKVPAPSGTNVTMDALHKMEQRIHQSMDAKVAAVQSGGPPMADSRIAALEHQVKQIHTQQGHMERWVKETTQQQGSQIQQLQGSMEQQAQQMTQLFDKQMERMEHPQSEVWRRLRALLPPRSLPTAIR